MCRLPVTRWPLSGWRRGVLAAHRHQAGHLLLGQLDLLASPGGQASRSATTYSSAPLRRARSRSSSSLGSPFSHVVRRAFPAASTSAGPLAPSSGGIGRTRTAARPAPAISSFSSSGSKPSVVCPICRRKSSRSWRSRSTTTAAPARPQDARELAQHRRRRARRSRAPAPAARRRPTRRRSAAPRARPCAARRSPGPACAACAAFSIAADWSTPITCPTNGDSTAAACPVPQPRSAIDRVLGQQRQERRLRERVAVELRAQLVPLVRGAGEEGSAAPGVALGQTALEPQPVVLDRGPALRLVAREQPQLARGRVRLPRRLPVEPRRALRAALHPALVRQHLQVPADRRLRQRQGVAEVGDAQLAPLQQPQDAQPRRVGEARHPAQQGVGASGLFRGGAGTIGLSGWKDSHSWSGARPVKPDVRSSHRGPGAGCRAPPSGANRDRAERAGAGAPSTNARGDRRRSALLPGRRGEPGTTSSPRVEARPPPSGVSSLAVPGAVRADHAGRYLRGRTTRCISRHPAASLARARRGA